MPLLLLTEFNCFTAAPGPVDQNLLYLLVSVKEIRGEESEYVQLFRSLKATLTAETAGGDPDTQVPTA